MEDEGILNIQVTDSLILGDYLKKLLCVLWNEGSNFSSKRPLGDSDWQYIVYAALVKNKVLPGKLDEWGGCEEVDVKVADTLIARLIVESF